MPDCKAMTRRNVYERAARDLPLCVEYDPLQMQTIDDLRWACRIQLDLIEEGQDGTDNDDADAIRLWMKRYGAPRITED